MLTLDHLLQISNAMESSREIFCKTPTHFAFWHALSTVNWKYQLVTDCFSQMHLSLKDITKQWCKTKGTSPLSLAKITPSLCECASESCYMREIRQLYHGLFISSANQTEGYFTCPCRPNCSISKGNCALNGILSLINTEAWLCFQKGCFVPMVGWTLLIPGCQPDPVALPRTCGNVLALS